VKKGEQPELLVRWWKSSQPAGLRGAGRLEDALKDYETARRRFESDSGAPQAATAYDALDAVAAAARAAATEAAKVKGNPEMEWTVDALKKFDRPIGAARKWIEDRTEEADDGEFGNTELYHEYLLIALKRLRGSKAMNFGIVLGKTREDHRLALHKGKSGKALAAVLVKQTGLHQMTYGIARTDATRGDVMVLDVEGRELPGLAKKGTLMLKRFKPLPFKQLKLRPDDADIDDDADDD
jgi:hypothetical protein